MTLRPLEFANPDPQIVEAELINEYEAVANTTLFPGDPIRLFLESVAVVIAQQRFLIDYSAKQNLLAFSNGDFLDHLGNLVGTFRLPAQAARVTMKFSLDIPLAFPVVIPLGTRTTPDGEVIFATEGEGIIEIGATEVEISSIAEVTGNEANGLVPGQINQLVDAIAYVALVENTTTSEGGSGIEGDESFRQRIQEAPAQFSVAGPNAAYRFHALSAHPDIVDVQVDSPQPGDVDVYVLLTGGVIPGQDILDLVEATLDPETVVPLNDRVFVKAPVVNNYDIDLTYYIHNEDEGDAVAIGQAVNEKVNDFIAWQAQRIGRDLNPSKLISDIYATGVKRVEVTSPVFTVMPSSSIAKPDSISVVYGGIEDE